MARVLPLPAVVRPVIKMPTVSAQFFRRIAKAGFLQLGCVTAFADPHVNRNVPADVYSVIELVRRGPRAETEQSRKERNQHQ